MCPRAADALKPYENQRRSPIDPGGPLCGPLIGRRQVSDDPNQPPYGDYPPTPQPSYQPPEGTNPGTYPPPGTESPGDFPPTGNYPPPAGYPPAGSYPPPYGYPPAGYPPVGYPPNGGQTAYYGTPPGYPGPMAPATSGWAIASLILSLANWLVLPVIGAILGIVFGHIALGEIKASQGRVEGRGVAMAGLIIGYVSLGLAVCVIAVVIIAIAASGPPPQ